MARRGRKSAGRRRTEVAEGPHEDNGGRVRRSLRATWKYAVALGLIGVVLSYVVPRALDSGTTAVKEIVRPEAPLVVTVRHPGEYQSETFFTPMYVLATTQPQDVPADVVQDETRYYAWAREQGGVPGQEQPLRLTLRGRDEQPVIVDAIRARLVERREPLRGWFTHDRGCGGVQVREARIDLDAEPPAIAFSDGGPDEAGKERLALTLQVTSTDVEVIDVLAQTRRGSVKWELEILYTAAGTSGTLTVNDRGRPFEVTALAPGRAEFYLLDYESASFVREAQGDPSEDGLFFC